MLIEYVKRMSIEQIDPESSTLLNNVNRLEDDHRTAIRETYGL
jgi:hypothetical protein